MSQVAKEVAEAEFQRFCDLMDLDVDTSEMDDEDRKSLDQAKRRVCLAIQDGRLTIDDAGQPTFAPKEGEPIVFHEPTGETIMDTDAVKKSKDVTKMVQFMVSMTRTNMAVFRKMPQRDLRVCQSITALFLG